MKLIYVILFITLVTGCISRKNQLDSNSKHDEVPMSPQLIFINYKATKSKGNLIRIELINKKIVDGNLKKGDSRESISSEMNFKCVQLDENTIVIDSLYISNPLIKDVEYVNDDGSLSKKRIELDSAEFSVRLQLNHRTKFISLKTKNITLSKISL
jgi:hypothetical protein